MGVARKREYLHWLPAKGERVAINAHRWWARKTNGEFDDLDLAAEPVEQIPLLSGLGTVLRRLPAWEIADYEVVMDGEGAECWRTYCYHYDELSKA